MTRQRGNCITCCTSFIISTGLTVIFLWLTVLRTQQPKLFIQSLNTTTSHHNNNTINSITFLFKFTNPNNFKGIQYDTVRLAFAVFLNTNTTHPLANATLDAFYQGHGKTAHKWGSVGATGAGVNRTVDGGRVFLRVDLVTRVKYRVYFFYTKRHRLAGGANVEVDVRSGEKADPKGIRLGNVPPRIGSGAAPIRGYCFLLLRFFVCLCSFSLPLLKS